MIKLALEKAINEGLSEMWAVLTPDEKRLITDNFAIHRLKKNQIIYAEHEEPENMWIVLDGKVKRYKDGVGGRQQILRLIRPVQCFGYRAYFARETYVSSAAAMESSTLGAIPLTVVDRLIKENPQVAWFFIHELSRNLGSSDNRMVSLTQKHIRGRLAEGLMALRDSYGMEDDGVTLRVYMAREDLAALCNMTTSNAIRTLTAFAEERLIVVDGRQIKITDENTLRKISKYG